MDTDHIVDGHLHVGLPTTTDEREVVALATSKWWRDDASVRALTATLDAAGIRHGVLVQAVGRYGYDCTYAAQATVADPKRFSFVGAIDLASSDPAQELLSLATTSPLRGIRLMGVAEQDSNWIRDGRGDEILSCAHDLGLPVVVTVFADSLGELADLANRHLEVSLCIDHCGFPELGSDGAWDRLVSLAQVPSVFVKVTSFNLDRVDAGPRAAERVLEGFGSERVLWGSDFPQHQGRTYAELLALGIDSVRGATPRQREEFLGGTCRRLGWA